MTEQVKAATIRAIVGGTLLGFAAFLAEIQPAAVRTADVVADAGITGATVLVGYMIARGIAEGLIDSNRAPTPADVGQPPR